MLTDLKVFIAPWLPRSLRVLRVQLPAGAPLLSRHVLPYRSGLQREHFPSLRSLLGCGPGTYPDRISNLICRKRNRQSTSTNRPNKLRERNALACSCSPRYSKRIWKKQTTRKARQRESCMRCRHSINLYGYFLRKPQHL
jgi:hypothetical protein